MSKILICCLLYIYLFIPDAGAQSYDLKVPTDNFKKKCGDFTNMIASRASEMQFGLNIDDRGNIIFLSTSKELFDQIFNSSNDALAIDIVLKDQYSCNKASPAYKDGFHKGALMAPMYLKDMKKNMMITDNGIVLVNYGKIDNSYANKDIELNMVLVQNKNVCSYNNFFDIKRYKWQLLDMGMYMDTLASIENSDSLMVKKGNITKTSYLSKTMQFIVPFNKNEVDYSPEEVKPIHDSLNYTDYYIKKISIRSYSSIEGTESKNLELQKKRAESIVKALQSYQRPEIMTEITVAENWVEFLDDISKGNFRYMENLSKLEIKEKLKDKKLFEQLEPYLKKHRKAILLIELDKITTYKESSESTIVALFNKAIADKNVKKAKEIQDAVFERIKDNELPIEILDKLEMPKQLEYSLLLNKKVVFRYSMDYDYLRTLRDLQELQDIFPNDPKIRYNICVIKFKVWANGSPLVDKDKFLVEINDLKKYGIHPVLLKKMLVNYNIIASEIYMAEQKFDKKDICLKYIMQNYKQTKMDDNDLLNLAQYFVSYTKSDFAISLITPRIKKLDISEDLLFYYINLTITNNEIKDEYKKIVLNAINVNRSRFCDIFNAFGKGGITFQLLDNPVLKKLYCETCGN